MKKIKFLLLSMPFILGLVLGGIVHADSDSPDSMLSPAQRAAVSSIDEDIQVVQGEISTLHNNLTTKTRVLYESYLQLNQVQADFPEGNDSAGLEAGDEIGTVIGMKGSAVAQKLDILRDLGKGRFVYEKETIITGANSNVEIRFLDDTIFSQGPDSRLNLDSYVYDPEKAASSGISVSLMQGVFRHVTGRIAQQNPERVKIESPLTVIGIRGTTTVHMVAPSESHGVEDISQGSSVVAQDQFDEVQVITSPMVMVDVFPDRPMSPQRAMTPEEKSLFRSIAPAALSQPGVSTVHGNILAAQREILNMSKVLDISKNKESRLQRDRDRAISQSAGCFPGEAMVIMQDGSSRKFLEISSGDMVMTYDIGYDSLVAKPVLEVYTFDTNHLYTINGHLVTTGGERLLTQEGWKKVNSLKVGDKVLMGRDMVDIEIIDYQSEDLKVYNLHVADTHNFYVATEDSGSYLVHNSCGGGGGSGGGGK